LIQTLCFSNDPTRDISRTLDLMSGRIDVGSAYHNTHDYSILAYDENTIDDLLYMLNDDAYFQNWNSVTHQLGTILAIEKNEEAYNQLKNFILRIEERQEITPRKQISILSSAYTGLLYYGTNDAFNFVVKRTKSGFWGDNMPNYDSTSSLDGSIYNHKAIYQAIGALSAHPDGWKAVKFLEDYIYSLDKNNPDYENLKGEAKAGISVAAVSVRHHKQRLKAYKIRTGKDYPGAKEYFEKYPLKPKLNQAVQTPETVKEDPKPVVVKKEEPKPVEKEEELKPEPAQEEEKSPLTLYLIGAIALIGIFLVTRKKKS